MEKKTIGKFISVLRRAQGLTQRELGDMLYVSDKTVSRWERDECTPDLSLIPAIADIFGVTADELLRGERKGTSPTAPSVSSEQSEAEEKAYEAYQKKKSDRQWHTMLRRRMTVYNNLSYISIGLGILALIGAIIANLAFTRGLVGFCIAAVCLAGGVICQICFAANALMPTDEEEKSDRVSQLHSHNHQVITRSVKVMLLELCVLAFCLPIAPYTHYGLAFGFWLWEGALCVVCALLIAWMAYALTIRRTLVRHELLAEESEERKALRRAWYQSIRRHLSVFLPIALVLCIGCGIVEALNPWHVADPLIFEDYKSFCAYMEEEAKKYYSMVDEGYDVYIDGNRVQVSTDQEIILGDENDKDAQENYGDGTDERSYDIISVEDENGNLLCAYAHVPGYRVQWSFDSTSTGLPVKVYTPDALDNGWATLDGIQTGMILLIAADFLLCAGLLIRKRIKLFPRTAK